MKFQMLILTSIFISNIDCLFRKKTFLKRESNNSENEPNYEGIYFYSKPSLKWPNYYLTKRQLLFFSK